MQQRQPRLGDVLDDYCPRERRLTNHAVVAMINDDVKRTRCTTCDAEHEYKHATVPRQRRKTEPAALAAPVAAAPKKVVHDVNAPASEKPIDDLSDDMPEPFVDDPPGASPATALTVDGTHDGADDQGHDDDRSPVEEGPVHRTLIRAQLPRQEGQPPAPRPAPEFTIRQPTGGARPGRFRPRAPRSGDGGAPFQNNRSFTQSGQGNRSNGNGNGNFAGGGRSGNNARPQGPSSNRPGGRRPGPAGPGGPGGAGRNKRSK